MTLHVLTAEQMTSTLNANEMYIISAKEKNMLEIINNTFHGQIFQKLVACPDRKTFKNKRFIFLNSFANVEYFIKTFPNAKWMYTAHDRVDEYFKFKELEKQNKLNKKSEIIKSDFKFKTKPFYHQLKAFEISKNLESYALLFEQGCGKTKVVLDIANHLLNMGKIECLVAVTPNDVHRDWINEAIPEHLNCKSTCAYWKSNVNKKEKKIWDDVKISTGLKVFTFNIEAFVSKKVQDELIEILKKFKCLLTIDESQTIKNPSAKRTKFFIKIRQLAKYRRILTGTPMTNGVQNIYTQFKFLDPNIIGISSYYAFRNRYCVMGGWENKQIISYKMIDDLQEKIKNHSMRVLKSECFDLPKKTWQKAYFDLTKEQLEKYRQVNKEGLMLLENDNKLIVLEFAITRLIKMQQIASGFFYDAENNKTIDIVPYNKNPRLLKLRDLLLNINGKVIIWARFTKDIENILRLVKEKGVRYDGRISSDEKEINKKKFKTDPNIKYFVANPQAGARGLNLTEASTAIYYSNSHNLEYRMQSEDRCHRIGTKHSVNYIDLQANKTIDKKIINCLRAKKKISDLFLQDPKSLFLED